MLSHGMQAEKGAADEQMSFVFSKKKAVVAEKRQKKEQKEEAEKHIRMQKELVRPAQHTDMQTCLLIRVLSAASLTHNKALSCTEQKGGSVQRVLGLPYHMKSPDCADVLHAWPPSLS